MYPVPAHIFSLQLCGVFFGPLMELWWQYGELEGQCRDAKPVPRTLAAGKTLRQPAKPVVPAPAEEPAFRVDVAPAQGARGSITEPLGESGEVRLPRWSS
jgi:hypothetical protein